MKRDRVIALLMLLSLLVGCSGSDSTGSSAIAAPAMMVLDGALVRGTAVAVRFTGLVETTGEHVSVIVETPEPPSSRAGSFEVGRGTVADDSTLQISIVVPNALISGEEEGIIPLEPGVKYRLRIRSLENRELSDTLSFVADSAEDGATYRISAQSGAGSVECGAPPVLIGFDGKLWAPTTEHGLAVPETGLEGTFLVRSSREAEFTSSAREVVAFQTVPDYSC